MEFPLGERNSFRSVGFGGSLVDRVHDGLEGLSRDMGNHCVERGIARNAKFFDGNRADERKRFVARSAQIELAYGMEVGRADGSGRSESGVGSRTVFSKFFPHAFAQKLAIPLPHRFERVGKEKVVYDVTALGRSFEEVFRTEERRIDDWDFPARIRDAGRRAFEKLFDVDSEKSERKKAHVRKDAVSSADLRTHGKGFPAFGFRVFGKL